MSDFRCMRVVDFTAICKLHNEVCTLAGVPLRRYARLQSCDGTASRHAHSLKSGAVAAELLAKGAEAAAQPPPGPKRSTQRDSHTPAATLRCRSTGAQAVRAPGAAPKRPSSRAAPHPRRSGGAHSTAGGLSAPVPDQSVGRRAGITSADSLSAQRLGAAVDRSAGATDPAPAATAPPRDLSPDGVATATSPRALGLDDAKHFVDHVEAGGTGGDTHWGEGAAEESDAEEGGKADAEEVEAAAAAQTEVKRAANQWRRNYQALAARARQLVERRRQLAWARASLTAQFLTRRSRLAAQVELQRAALLQVWVDAPGVLHATSDRRVHDLCEENTIRVTAARGELQQVGAGVGPCGQNG